MVSKNHLERLEYILKSVAVQIDSRPHLELLGFFKKPIGTNMGPKNHLEFLEYIHKSVEVQMGSRPHLELL